MGSKAKVTVKMTAKKVARRKKSPTVLASILARYRRVEGVTTYWRRTSVSRSRLISSSRRSSPNSSHRRSFTGSRRESPANSVKTRPKIINSGSSCRIQGSTSDSEMDIKAERIIKEEENKEIEKVIRNILKNVDRVDINDSTDTEEIVYEFIEHKECKGRCRIQYRPCKKEKEFRAPETIEELRRQLQIIKKDHLGYDIKTVEKLKEIYLSWTTRGEDVSKEDFKVYREFMEARNAIRGTSDTEDENDNDSDIDDMQVEEVLAKSLNDDEEGLSK